MAETEQAVVPVEEIEPLATEEQAESPEVQGEVEAQPEPEAEVEAEHPDDSALNKARESLRAAQENYLEATKSILDDANEYLLQEFDQEVADLVREAQLETSKKWYNFWEKASRIPKDSKYTTVENETKTFKQIASDNLTLLKTLTSSEPVENAPVEVWTKVTNSQGVKVELNPARSKDAKFYKLTTAFNVSPRTLLLVLLRAPILGAHDDDLMYFREHYNFVGGKTSLVHSVRKVSSYGSVLPRDFFDLTSWQEDTEGNILYAAQGIKAPALKLKLPSGKVVKGQTAFLGVKISKTENGKCEVTVLSKVKVGGWVPQFVLDWNVPSVLVKMVKGWEKAAKAVEESGEQNADSLVAKYVFRELEN